MKFSNRVQSAILAIFIAPAAFAQSATFSFQQPGGAGTATQQVDFGTKPGDTAGVTTGKKTSKSKRDGTKAFEPGKIHPDALVKATPAPEINLPGVAKIEGADANALDFTRAQVVEFNNPATKTVIVSNQWWNLIQLPWLDPKVQGTDEVEVRLNKLSRNVYVRVQPGVDHSVQLWIEDKKTDKVLGLQLSGKSEIPAQAVIVRDTTPSKAPLPKSNTYVEQIQQRMETVALGNAPSGYSEIQPRLPAIVRNGLVITPAKIYSSADTEIFVYDVANPGPNRANLTEEEFDGPAVTAVSIYPKPLVDAKEHVKVIVETKKGR
ncbi:type-F conjugative transfer system secretin TraK [Herbaspirillum huttiense]|uniref:type-F conjugative transfer system secretin TraK n=1 Tax=Herbaspirillum huttiense TaxID=863372 RepID=UPI002176B866|nr:type-F conjugative transfer system secretin TraK [Herbaspirillum huttiense]UWE19365.1 type-F conjugative transfer system secretin TraK [Herbaspirillum huttiense]